MLFLIKDTKRFLGERKYFLNGTLLKKHSQQTQTFANWKDFLLENYVKTKKNIFIGIIRPWP